MSEPLKNKPKNEDEHEKKKAHEDDLAMNNNIDVEGFANMIFNNTLPSPLDELVGHVKKGDDLYNQALTFSRDIQKMRNGEMSYAQMREMYG